MASRHARRGSTELLDKNPHRLEEAHHEFAAIQAAYEVLSDPQERAWYDRHRLSILSQRRRAADADDAPTLDDLMKFFSADVYRGYDDGPKGFFAVYRTLFEYMEACETDGLWEDRERERDAGRCRRTNERSASFTSFGSKNTPYEPAVRQFYEKWLHFSTTRAFDEGDLYMATFDNNRRMRRAMEKENARAREQLRREFSETVRELAAFVRKRDPRWRDFQRAKGEEREREEAERKARERRRREQEAAAYVEQDWSRLGTEQFTRAADEFFSPDSGDEDSAAAAAVGEEDSEHEDEFYCAPCRKLFKTASQWKNHAQSKKHRAKLLSLGFDLDAEDGDENGEREREEHASTPLLPADRRERKDSPEDRGAAQAQEAPEDREAPEALGGVAEGMAGMRLDDHVPAKTKKARRAEQKKTGEGEDESHRCHVCGGAFATRNQLFRHVRDEGHESAAGHKGTKNRRK